MAKNQGKNGDNTRTESVDKLLEICGNWKGVAKTWFKPGELADQSEVTATIRPALNGTFVIYEYSGTLMGESMTGLALIGYNKQKQQFQQAWIDNCHTGTAIMFSESGENPDDLSVKGDYRDLENKTTWGWTTQFTKPDQNRLDVVCYNITPDGQKSKAVEIHYQKEE